MHCLFYWVVLRPWPSNFWKKIATTIFETYSSRWTFWYTTTLINKEKPRDDISNCTNLETDTANIFGKDIALIVTSSGHYCVPIGRTEAVSTKTVAIITEHKEMADTDEYSRTSEIRTPLVPGISFGFLRRPFYWMFGNLKGRMMKTYQICLYVLYSRVGMRTEWNETGYNPQ